MKMTLGLGAVLAAGELQLAQSEALQIGNMMTQMATQQLTTMANQQKTMMDAVSGIGSAYSNGAADMYQSIYTSNQAMGNAFRKAGGH